MIEIRLLEKDEQIPYELLLLADESIDSINKYLLKSKIYIAQKGSEIIGIFCLYKNNETDIELKNIAIKEKYQRLGYGTTLIDFIKTEVKKNFKTLIVGTADVGFRQIKFYEKNGFIKFDVRKNFFLENYPEPIIENGERLKDMILLKFEL